MPSVRCICFSRCRRDASQPERIVSVSTRDRHREEDRHILETRAYDGEQAPALLLDALINNYLPPSDRRAEPDVLLRDTMFAGGEGSGGPSDDLMEASPDNQGSGPSSGAEGAGPSGEVGSAGLGGTFSSGAGTEHAQDDHGERARRAEDGADGSGGEPDVDDDHAHVGQSLLERLLGRPPSTSPPILPTEPPLTTASTSADGFRISFYAAWRQSGATEKAFRDLSAAVASEGLDAGTIHRTRQLIREVSGLQTVEHHMCRKGCLAFTGQHAGLEQCSCGLNRYKPDGRTPYKTFTYVPVLPRILAYYSNPAWAETMRYRHRRQQAAAAALGADGSVDPAHRFTDVTDGASLHSLSQDGFLQDERDCCIAISTDGAQILPHKKASSVWLVLLQIVNLPPSLRVAMEHLHMSILVPGPNSPKDLDSFLVPLCEELAAAASEGVAAWDGSRGEWFNLKIHLTGVYADQPASAKVSHFVGNNGNYGCRQCLIRAVRVPGPGNAAYWPLQCRHGGAPRNEGRPAYEPFSLPIRTEQQFRHTMHQLATASTQARKAAIATQTGFQALPVVMFDPATKGTDLFPLDPFHLFNFNVPRLMWKTWLELGDASPPLPVEFGLSAAQRSHLGLIVASNAKNYPTSFSSRAPRDIAQYSNTSYRMVEWGSVFHHFLPAFLHHIDAPAAVCDLLDNFLEGVNLSMAREGATFEQIHRIRFLFGQFAVAWEQMYAYDDARVHRATMSVHMLLHVAEQMMWTGSMRATSQAACERYIGKIKHELGAFKQPDTVMLNRAVALTELTLAQLHLDQLAPPPDNNNGPRCALKVVITNAHKALAPDQHAQETALLRQHRLRASTPRYGKLSIRADSDEAGVERPAQTVRGLRIQNQDSRSASRVMARRQGLPACFDVVHFLVARGEGPDPDDEREQAFALAYKLEVSASARHFLAGQWASELELLSIKDIVEVIAVLDLGTTKYAVRRGTANSEADL